MQKFAAAQQKGDPAEVQRLMTQYQALLGGIPDSASLDKAALPKCGARPVKPASMVQAAALNARADSLHVLVQGLEGSGTGVMGAAVGMTDVQAHMVWERIASWLSGMRKDAPITVTFTRAEYDELVSRRSALRKAFNGS